MNGKRMKRFTPGEANPEAEAIISIAMLHKEWQSRTR